MSLDPAEPPLNWSDATAELSPVILGVATGIVLGDLMHRGARRPVAFALACLGVVAAAPFLMDAVKEKVAGPNTRRGTQRTLRKIREGSGAPAREIDFIEEELGEQIFVG